MRIYIAVIIFSFISSLVVGLEDLENIDETKHMQPVSERPVKVIHMLQPGEREYLSPNLIGLQNIATTFLPLSMNFLNIIDAFREIVNGVRYEILLNAINIRENNADIVCRLVILEKPWLRTQWGDKVRILQYTNCTDGTNENASSIDLKTEGWNGEHDRYIQNSIFGGDSRDKLSTNELKRLEDQIFPSVISSKNVFSKTTTTRATTETETVDEHVTAFPYTTESIITTTSNTDNSERVEDTSESESTTIHNEDENAKTENIRTIPELSEDEKQWLDNFFSIGTFAFEKSDYRNEQESQPGGAPGGRYKRASNHILENYKKLHHADAEKHLSSTLKNLATTHGINYNLIKIHKAYQQVVSGTLTTIDCDLENSEGKVKHCNVAIWSQPWRSNGTEITIKCPNDGIVKKRVARSIENAEKKIHKKRNLSNLNKIEHLFAKYQLKYKRKYHTTAEKQMRFRIFAKNLKLIEELNHHEMGTAKYGITEFADLTTEEFKARTGLLPKGSQDNLNLPHTVASIASDTKVPEEFDWRDKGVVSKVKNQGLCGSCWAFSVTGNIESLHAIKTGVLEEYSEQELLDCDSQDHACSGGLPDNAFDAIKKIGGLELESDYPYHGRKGHCEFNSSQAHVYVKDHVDLPKNETAMTQWLVTNGPFSIGLNANVMQFYRGGVSHPWHVLCSKNDLNHGVLIVGYGITTSSLTHKTLPYWIIKNSWGTKWGERGYYRLYRGDNSCGVSEMASTAILMD